MGPKAVDRQHEGESENKWDVLAMVRHCSLAKLDNIITINESTILFHTHLNKGTVQAVDAKGSVWPSEGQGPCNKNQAAGFGILWL